MRRSFITAKGGIIRTGDEAFHFRVIDGRFHLKAIYIKNIEVFNFDDEIDAYFSDVNARLKFINKCYSTPMSRVTELVKLCERSTWINAI